MVFQMYEWYFHQKTLFTEIDGGENIYSVFHGSSAGWCFTGMIAACWGQTDLVGQTQSCSRASTGARAQTLPAQT